MAQKMILVKTPLTTDGTSPIIGTDGRQVYSESILTETARPILEKRNLTLNAHLKVIIEPYDGPIGVRPAEEVEVILPPASTQPKTKTLQNATA